MKWLILLTTIISLLEFSIAAVEDNDNTNIIRRLSEQFISTLQNIYNRISIENSCNDSNFSVNINLAIEEEIKKSINEDKDSSYTTKSLIKNFKLAKVVKVNGREFYLGQPKNLNGYQVIMAYTTDTSKDSKHHFYRSLLFYKSHSDGSWRSAPGMQIGPDGQLAFSKGNFHYVQETKPVEALCAQLDEFSRKFAIITEKISDRDLEPFLVENSRDRISDKSISHFYDRQISEIRIKGISSVINDHYMQPGMLFRKDYCDRLKNCNGQSCSISKFLKNINFTLPPGFMPDFKKPAIKVYNSIHSLLGEITIKVFLGKLNDRNVEWHIAKDSEGRVWIDRINYENCPMNVYGNCSEVIQSGLLTHKPLEYPMIVDCLNIPNDISAEFIGGYADVTPILFNLQPIREFIENDK